MSLVYVSVNGEMTELQKEICRALLRDFDKYRKKCLFGDDPDFLIDVNIDALLDMNNVRRNDVSDYDDEIDKYIDRFKAEIEAGVFSENFADLISYMHTFGTSITEKMLFLAGFKEDATM